MTKKTRFWEFVESNAILKDEGPDTDENRLGICVTTRARIDTPSRGGYLYKVTTNIKGSPLVENLLFVGD